MRVLVRFEPGLTHPLLSKANLHLPTHLLQTEDLYEYLRTSFHLKTAFRIYIEGFYLPKRQKLGDIVRNGCEVLVYREDCGEKRREGVCKFYIAMRQPPFGVVLVPSTGMSSAPIQASFP